MWYEEIGYQGKKRSTVVGYTSIRGGATGCKNGPVNQWYYANEAWSNAVLVKCNYKSRAIDSVRRHLAMGSSCRVKVPILGNGARHNLMH